MMDLNGVILRPYQVEAHEATAAAIRKYEGPFFLNMSVGAGKTLSIAAVCKRFNELGMTVLVLARQGELVEQDSNDCWLVGCAKFCFLCQPKPQISAASYCFRHRGHGRPSA